VEQRPIRVRIDPPADDDAPKKPARITRRGVIAVVALFVVTLVAAQTCQQSQIRISKERAISVARPEAGFTPQRTQVRLVRQGLNARPYWAVSLSVPGEGDTFRRLATVRVDANTGKVAAVTQSPPGR
jgi:hypothetical protein